MTSMIRKTSEFWADYFKIRLNWNESGKESGYYSKGKKQSARNRRLKD